MKPRLLLAMIVLTGLGIGLVVHYFASPGEPQYNGKPVQHWVDDCVRKRSDTFSSRDPEIVALVAIGSNAVPFLIRAIQQEPGFVGSKFYQSMHRSLPAAVSEVLPVPLAKETVHLRAYISLASLGPTAMPAVPFLIKQFHANNRDFDSVGFALGAIGPGAKESIPVLTNAFHSTNFALRWTAARTLASVCPDYPLLFPSMLTELTSTNAVARRGACLVLGRLGPRAKGGTALLREVREDKDREVRRLASWALHQIEGEMGSKVGADY